MTGYVRYNNEGELVNNIIRYAFQPRSIMNCMQCRRVHNDFKFMKVRWCEEFRIRCNICGWVEIHVY